MFNLTRNYPKIAKLTADPSFPNYEKDSNKMELSLQSEKICKNKRVQ